jgi:peroxiredoxin
MPSLNRLYQEHLARGLKVFAVSVDEDVHLVREFLIKVHQDFPILLDPGARVAKQVFAVSSFPTTLLVDRGNRIRDVWVGERDWDAVPIRDAIKVLFEG